MERRLLVINPNTNPDVTDNIRTALASLAAPGGPFFDVVSPPKGPFSIETPADRTDAVSAVLDLIDADPDRDAYLLACFDDIAVAEARERVPGTVLSMAQAAIETAAASGRPFTVVTTVGEQIPTIEALLDKYGAANGRVRACRIGVAEASARTQRAEERLAAEIRAAVESDAAEAIVLGSGAYAGRAEDLQRQHGLPVIDGLGEAFRRLTGAAPARLAL